MAKIDIGTEVIYEDRDYLVRGFSPMSRAPRRVFLEDLRTGESIDLDVAALDSITLRHPPLAEVEKNQS
jgi:hypothetical protein